MKVECEACSGTGLYSGFAEPVGVAVICSGCRGKGHGPGTKEFVSRSRLHGIHTVYLDGGLWFTRGDEKPPSITVEKFYSNE